MYLGYGEMHIIDSTHSNSCFEVIPVGSQIMYYIYNTSNKIPYFHGKWWKYLDNTMVCYARETDRDRDRERKLIRKAKQSKPQSFVRWLTMSESND